MSRPCKSSRLGEHCARIDHHPKVPVSVARIDRNNDVHLFPPSSRVVYRGFGLENGRRKMRGKYVYHSSILDLRPVTGEAKVENVVVPIVGKFQRFDVIVGELEDGFEVQPPHPLRPCQDRLVRRAGYRPRMGRYPPRVGCLIVLEVERLDCRHAKDLDGCRLFEYSTDWQCLPVPVLP